MSERVGVFEVSLRDGLQNEPVVVPTEHKLAHLHRLLAAGVVDIEVTSFVRASRIPALADAEAFVAALPRNSAARFWALVPNEVGMDRALTSGIRHVCTFLSASESHNLKNVNRTVKESVGALRRVIGTAVDEGVPVRAYVSTAFGCPYEGEVPVAKVVAVAMTMVELGADVVTLGDTTGVGVPTRVHAVLEALVAAGLPIERVALHAHDTWGTGLLNAYAAFQAGVRRFDGSVAGIGGCPYAPGASGNVATEDLVHLFEAMGVSTGIDLAKLAEAGQGMAEVLGRPLPGRVHQAMAAGAGVSQSMGASSAQRRSA